MAYIKKILPILALMMAFACSSNKELLVDFSDPQIVYSGRIGQSADGGAELYWSGTSITLNFEGESISAEMKEDKGDNYYNVILDHDSLFILRPDTLKHFYTLASKLPKGKHTIEIFKRAEWTRGTTTFYGFHIEGNAEVLPKATPSNRKIEFYGNSITAGYAVEDTSGKDSPDSTYTNIYKSYATVTARHYNADYRCICRNGIGITISWFPQIMPEIYDRLNPNDPNSKWDFSLYTPDLVVINLFQNDSWLVNRPDRTEFKTNFGDKAPEDDYFINAYQQFVTHIRTHYPNTSIICMLGNMDATKDGSIWMDYIEKAVSNLNDDKIYKHFVPFKGTDGHPSVKEQEDMANSLIDFIDTHIDW